jgi:hypothetical protein
MMEGKKEKGKGKRLEKGEGKMEARIVIPGAAMDRFARSA